jgi:Photosynthesis system II assembly factor YCF48
MPAKTKRRPPKGRQLHPKPVPSTPPRPWLLYALAATALVGIAVAAALLSFRGGDSNPGKEASAGLPDTPDYHSLLVNPGNPRQLVLGTHYGLYVSSDGGRHWAFDALSGDDAMNLARSPGKTIWLAGHLVFKKSSDGGRTWADVRPTGLPSLDIHGFAVDPRNPRTLYAAVAQQGLYRSRDGGRSFSLVSSQVGGNVMALVALPDGRLLAGDMQQGLLESHDRGASWRLRLRAQLMGIAVNPSDPDRLLATGAGIALSTDGGRTWRSVLNHPAGVGPVAWSPSNPKLAYAVGFDRTFYRSDSGGSHWQPVEGS